ncbi:MAG: DUF3000 domain-containing protein [Bifidobacterium crudilactis]|nr:DUF3000 domain-containing protein [Bifidobacterium crudilactis]
MAEIYSIPVRDMAFHTRESGEGEKSSCSLSRPAGVRDELWYAVESVHHMVRVESIDYQEIQVPSSMADAGIGVELSYRKDAYDLSALDGISYSEGLRTSPVSSAHKSQDAARSRLASPSGWIMVLYSHVPRAEWDSQWRCVGFFTTEIAAQEHDSLTADMFLDDMTAHLTEAEPDSVRGTVTLTQNRSFGVIEQDNGCGCEIRVSWTPAGVTSHGLDAGRQVQMWARFIREIAS